MKNYINPPISSFDVLSERPAIDTRQLTGLIASIFDEVANNGDQALMDFTKKYDNCEIDRIEVDSVDGAFAQNNPTLIAAIEQASINIAKFHEAQRSSDWKINIDEGIEAGQRIVPIERIGIYIPGGTAPLISTILMLAIPAKLAGCKEIVLCSPPSYKGSIHPAILYTAKSLGISEIYQVGGAQAIAAMALGTNSIKPVNKIFGPGNQYVTAAKAYAMNYGVAMDLPAGPSELLIFADETSIPSFIAADLLSQAEHGVDSQVILVSTSQTINQEIALELQTQLSTLPRKEIAEKALENSRSLIFDEIELAFLFINKYAPEHLILASDSSEILLEKIQNAGSIFLGHFCPESAGDYASGTNHTLPTNGWAKSYSGVNLDAFVKKITFQKINKLGLQNLSNSITTLARAEALEAHARAIDIRLQSTTQ